MCPLTCGVESAKQGERVQRTAAARHQRSRLIFCVYRGLIARAVHGADDGHRHHRDPVTAAALSADAGPLAAADLVLLQVLRELHGHAGHG